MLQCSRQIYWQIELCAQERSLPYNFYSEFVGWKLYINKTQGIFEE